MTLLSASVILTLKHNSDWEDMDSDDEENDSDTEDDEAMNPNFIAYEEEFDENYPVPAYGQAILTAPDETEGQVLYR